MATLESPGVSLHSKDPIYQPIPAKYLCDRYGDSVRLKKGAFCTDIHFGKKSNSPVHNQDCLDYLDWFCEQVRNDPTIDYIGFLGDWNENRSSINIATLNASHQGANKLNQLGLPVFFVIGNHDLYHRNSREIHSIVPFQEFDNFIVIDEPKVFEEIEGGALFSPYIFHDEYPNLTEFMKVPLWAGHFEFQGFVITGYNVKMPHGPSALDFADGPKHILSGHFHKRQSSGNVHYIGNCFPMDFGDAGDFLRGMAVYDHVEQEVEYSDWPDCPKYIKCKLTDLLDVKVELHRNARVKCLVDVPISFEESTLLRQSFIDQFSLREFTLEESQEIAEVLSDTELSEETKQAIADDDTLSTIDDLVIQMLNEISSDKIDKNLLIEQYKSLSIA